MKSPSLPQRIDLAIQLKGLMNLNFEFQFGLLGLLAQWSTRSPTERKIPGSNPG
jgi:hypothetical protein